MFAHSLEEYSPSKTHTETDNNFSYNEFHQEGQTDSVADLMFQSDQMIAYKLEQQELEQMENQPCSWDDQLIAQALQEDDQRRLQEQRAKEEQEFKKLQVIIYDLSNVNVDFYIELSN